MKRLLLISAAATAIMLTACIHVDVDRPAPQPDAKPVASALPPADKQATSPEAGQEDALSAQGAAINTALRTDAPRRR